VRKSTILGLQKSLSSRLKKRVFPWALFMMIMDLILGKAMKKRKSQRGSLSPVSEPVSEQPSPRASQPASTVHPPMLTRDIQPCVSSYGAEHVVCYKLSGVFHSFYEPVSKYLEWNFLHILEPPNFISTSAFGEKMKDVTILLSWLHYLLLITDIINGLPVRKLLEWLWWKFSFT
jgi:hypothetical protein